MMKMKELGKYFLVMVLIVFSFYYTDQISKIIIYKSPLMKMIVNNKSTYNVDSTSALIQNDYIVPGIYGKEVNELDSYYQMKKENIFLPEKLVFNEVVPVNSIDSNKHLIINRANSVKRAVSIIVDDNDIIKEYMIKNKIKGNILINIRQLKTNSELEQLNYNDDYELLDKLMKNSNLVNSICYVTNKNKEYCLKENKYLVSPSYIVSNNSLVNTTVESGDIIFISNDLSLEGFKLLLKKISYQDLKIVYLSSLISEHLD